ncbi:long-chain fatty-acid-CoA ligase [Naegleria gruberi]|uniref:Long-chain fatty-acid-CoA ligase n=1 Tax=Naegleria gruberi TaxID=5762 RepID=D2VTB8_NAEGR|nr:long-chain fatty-acid-CoA ligase [Naegleria gruberi]EFC39832.1 long-chain fatty-acid-CoA ligase [Naegleria gruberi]|eukprot:XP_002672576.1 long-chain fatty-acid-CoA ligase [Naegleria gruberi strain NEG-M]
MSSLVLALSLTLVVMVVVVWLVLFKETPETDPLSIMFNDDPNSMDKHQHVEYQDPNEVLEKGEYMEETNIYKLRLWSKQMPNRPALWYKNQSSQAKEYIPITFKEYNDHVQEVAKSLLALGIKRGETCCIMSGNNKEWNYLDLGCLTVNVICGGIYFSSSELQVLHLLNHSEAKMVVVEKKDHFEKVKRCISKLTDLQKVVFINESVLNECLKENPEPLLNASGIQVQLWSWSDFIKLGENITQDQVDEIFKSIKTNDVCTVIYTSGTTGAPKAVQLTYRAVTSATLAARTIAKYNETHPDFDIENHNNTYLSVLPLAHIAERLLTIYIPLRCGYQVYFAESIFTLLNDLQVVRPHIFFGVPRIYEKIKSGIETNLSKVNPIVRYLIQHCMKQVSKYNTLVAMGRSTSSLLDFRAKLIYKFIVGPLKRKIGFDRTRVFGVGSAPISKDVMIFFSGLDAMLINIYGSSESSAMGSSIRPRALHFDSVGVPMPGTEIKIDVDGEVLIKAPSTMVGYAKDEKSTKAAFTEDGFLRTGDLGILRNGFLKITGRKKDIIMTKNGKNVAPAYFESSLQHDIINGSLMIGDDKIFLSAIVSLEPTQLMKYVKDHHKEFGVENVDSLSDLTPERALNTYHNHPIIYKLVESLIKQVNSKVSDAEQVKKFKILSKSFSIDGGEFTATLKTKRHEILKKYEKEIDEIYSGVKE